MIQTNSRHPQSPSRKAATGCGAVFAKAKGPASWIFCIINYLWVATSCYLHWTDGNAIQSWNTRQGPTWGVVGWGGAACVTPLNIVKKHYLQTWTWSKWKDTDRMSTVESRSATGQTHFPFSWTVVIQTVSKCPHLVQLSTCTHTCILYTETHKKPQGIFSWPGLSFVLNHELNLSTIFRIWVKRWKNVSHSWKSSKYSHPLIFDTSSLSKLFSCLEFSSFILFFSSWI